ncbi:MAG: SH3 domain-containing protein [Mogibacterium sp.]|nr:SH3 domain-containing protein [Mogibacterium sp.]
MEIFMNMNINKRHNIIQVRRTATVALIILLLLATFGAACPELTYATASSPTATAKINSSNGVNLRKTASTSGKIVASLSDNTKVTIKKEIFIKENSTSKKNRWYYVSVSGRSGYIRSDLVDNIKYSGVTANTSDAVNYRVGAGTRMTKKGTLNKGKSVTVRLSAKAAGSNKLWYRVSINGKTYYMCADYVQLKSAITSSSNSSASQSNTPSIETAKQSGIAKALLNKTSDGGSARYVYTFNSDNCKNLFTVSGSNGIYTPQGMAFDGKRYYVLFANDSGQCIATYSDSGSKLNTSKFPKNRGHLNGMTWNPDKGIFYIFKGNQTTIYTWNSQSNSFGTATTPYSSSGVGYDKVTKTFYASSQTGIRQYSSDGKFTHKKLFSRCKHSGTIYIQDCCGANGFVFHGISGSNKAKINYIDVYRVSDGKYMGSIKETFGEIESLIVDNEGFLQMLVNVSGTKEQIIKTPLNVYELN